MFVIANRGAGINKYYLQLLVRFEITDQTIRNCDYSKGTGKEVGNEKFFTVMKVHTI